MNAGDILRFFANRHPEKTAVHYLDRTVTYKELNNRVNRLANRFLSLGYRPNDKISILLQNCIEYLEIVFALAKIGAISVPINFRLVDEEIKYIVNDSESKGLILEKEFIENVDSVKSQLVVETDKYYVTGNDVADGFLSYEALFKGSSPDEPHSTVDENSCFVMTYTSGTTGRPKGVVASHKSKLLSFLAQAIEFKIWEDDTQLVAAPLCHSAGIFLCVQQLAVGGTVCIMKQFDAQEALKLIEEKAVTNTFMVPTMYNFILELPDDKRLKYDLSSVRVLLCAGAPLPTKVKEGMIGLFHNAGLYEYYGATESAFVTYLKPEDQRDKVRCAGKPFWGVEVKLVDADHKTVPVNEIGEIFVKSPFLFDSYYKRGKEGFVGEWFASGDLAKQDQDGFFYIVDRKVDMIISGGENIYPAEVEEVLYSHPNILEAAVIGIPDDRWGEAVRALVVLKKGKSSTDKEIMQFCRKKLAGYKVPRSVGFLDELPKSTSGKILKRELRDPYWKGKEIKV